MHKPDRANIVIRLAQNEMGVTDGLELCELDDGSRAVVFAKKKFKCKNHSKKEVLTFLHGVHEGIMEADLAQTPQVSNALGATSESLSFGTPAGV